ncbi:unnamed protein product [Cunninghamella echinulata]
MTVKNTNSTKLLRDSKITYQFIPTDNNEFEAPSSSSSSNSEDNQGFSLSKLLQYTGPGWLMAIAYLDPGNLIKKKRISAVQMLR